ncbi:Uncharacterized membrane protein [Enhydrobacter aerosaccus]|uniref:Uncharacterized membrane protein n=1 Tax=Enhydrobacter aerosaccus TaxID=225324 RepID=A0A1T4S1U2_9HYPH|nr:DUF1345 domain-containing protein [Enhydrobacter aerosaccus]SKA22203.1 Uncharacterized membrane protein [Enhydrobacter aerosaccus]
MTRKIRFRRRLHRLLLSRRRLFLAMVAGALLFLALPPSIRLVTRILMGWDLTAAIYVVSVFAMIARSTVHTCHKRASLYDEKDWVITVIVVTSAAASLGTIFSELAVIKSAQATPWISMLVTGATVVLSWTFTHLVFALHYANLYYRPNEQGVPGGLEFPGNRPPDYRDFVYYAFVIGCAAQTADVNTISPAMRRVSLIQGVISFVFNTAILALSINVGASLLS